MPVVSNERRLLDVWSTQAPQPVDTESNVQWTSRAKHGTPVGMHPCATTFRFRPANLSILALCLADANVASCFASSSAPPSQPCEESCSCRRRHRASGSTRFLSRTLLHLQACPSRHTSTPNAPRAMTVLTPPCPHPPIEVRSLDVQLEALTHRSVRTVRRHPCAALDRRYGFSAGEHLLPQPGALSHLRKRSRMHALKLALAGVGERRATYCEISGLPWRY